MEGLWRIIRAVDRGILFLLKCITIVCFICLTVLITANVVVRFVPVVSLHWFDEIIEMLYAYLVFYGSAALWITREHFSVGDWIGPRLIRNERGRHAYRLVLEFLVLVFVCVFAWYSLRLTSLAMDVTNVFAIPKKVLYSCLPASGAVMVVYSIRNIVVEAMALAGRETKLGAA